MLNQLISETNRNQFIEQKSSTPSTAKDDSIDWTFEGTWPYTPRWFESADGWMHYIDEGSKDAPTVVLLHGNPTWGYLYRNFISPS